MAAGLFDSTSLVACSSKSLDWRCSGLASGIHRSTSLRGSQTLATFGGVCRFSSSTMAAEDIAAGSAGAAIAAQQQNRQQRREGSSDREMICINHPGFDRLREFCFREDLGLVTRMRDLSDSFGKFHGSSGNYKRSVLHPSGKLCKQ